MKYLYAFIYEIAGYADYLLREILHPQWNSYFYWLIGLSLFFWSLEYIMPWRKNQSIIRKDFGLDVFYMFFNFFIFSLIGFAGVSKVGVMLFNDFLALFGVENLVAIKIETFPKWLAILMLFLAKDFIQFNIHRLLHAFPKLWEFHKVHHSVEEMGFAAHLRFHWMESIIYKSIAYIPMAMLGFDLVDFFYADLIAISIGHFNHSNIRVPLGPFKYLFNNPQMHIWHHAKTIPNKTGVNFGISLSIWDYLFKTNYIPHDGRDVALGFEDVEHYPNNFIDQMKAPFE
jgi:sterol desaturase/sphingolipid hydroxylase (fatty acid hydroxylase superfamily)